MNKIMTLHDLPVLERPRERLVEKGVSALSASEILALILGRGIAGEPVMATSQRLLTTFGSLHGIAQASLEDLMSLKGVGLAKATQLQACAEMARRMQHEAAVAQDSSKITSPQHVSQLIRKHITTHKKEHYVLVSLNARSKVTGIDTLSFGTLDAALVHPRETFEAAIRRHAMKVILAHNHPSGDPRPSEDDVVVTKRLVTAGKIMGIAVIDHIIVAEADFYSFQAHGLIDFGANQ